MKFIKKERSAVTSGTFDFLFVLMIAGAFFRLYSADSASYWYDELYSAAASYPSKSVVEVYHRIISKDVHPPLYQLFLWAWYNLFGISEVSGRFFSGFVGILLIPASYFLGKRVFDKEVGMYTALFVTFNYYFIYYSRETRSYSLLTLLAVVSFISFMRLLDEKKYATIPYAITTSLLINTHYFGFLVFISQCIIVFSSFYSHAIAKKVRLNFVRGSVIVCLSGIHLLQQVLDISSRKIDWIDMPSDNYLSEYFTMYFGGSPLAIVFTVLLLFGSMALLSRNSKHFNINIILIWIFTTLVTPYFMSVYYKPLLTMRNTVSVVPGILIFAAYGLSRITDRGVKVTIVAVIILFSCTAFLSNGLFTDKEKMDAHGARRQDYRTIILIAEEMNKKFNVYAKNNDLFEIYTKILDLPLQVKSLETLNADMSKGTREFLILGDQMSGEPALNNAKLVASFRADKTWLKTYVSLTGSPQDD